MRRILLTLPVVVLSACVQGGGTKITDEELAKRDPAGKERIPLIIQVNPLVGWGRISRET